MKMIITLSPHPESPFVASGEEIQRLLRDYGDVESVNYRNPNSPEDLARAKAVQLLKSIEGVTDIPRIHEVAHAAQILLSLSRGGK